MFNEAFKTRYIREVSGNLSRETRLRDVFAFTEPFEAAAGIDLYSFSGEALAAVVSGLSGGKKRTDDRVAEVRDYVRYAYASGVTTNQVPDSVFEPDVRELRLVWVANSLHLQTILDGYYEPESYLSFDNIYRMVYWCAFAGIFEEDLYAVSTDNADQLRRRVTVGGKEYQFPREAQTCFLNCCRLDAFYDVRITEDGRNPRRHQRIPGTELLRGRADGMSINTLKASLSRRNRTALGRNQELHRLNYAEVWHSGLFCRMASRQMARLPVDFSDAAMLLARRKCEGRTEKDVLRVARATEKRLRSDYERWKAAFRPQNLSR